MKFVKTFLLAMLVLCLTIVTACGNSNNTNSNTPKATNTAGAEQGGKEENAGGELEPLKLSFFFPGNPDTVMPRGEDDFVRTYLEKKFNVTIAFDTLPFGDEFNTRLNLKISSGDAPDLMVISGTSTVQLFADGVMGNIGAGLNPEVMPNFFKWVTPEVLANYQIEKGSTARGYVPVNPKPITSYFIRKDWLDALKLDYPTNYAELTEVVRAFTQDDPDGNKRNDTYGFTTPGNGQMVSSYFPQYNNHGIYQSMFIDPKTKNFRTAYTDPVIGEVLDDIRGWTDKGYVDPDWFLSDNATSEQKFAQGRIGIIWGAADQFAFDSNPNSYFNQLKQLYPNADVRAFNPFPDHPVNLKIEPGYSWSIAQRTIEKSPEKVDRIIQIVDWLFSEEGYLMTHYGIEDKHYTRSGNTITLNPQAYKEDVIDKGNFLVAWHAMTPERYTEPLGLEVVDPTLSNRDKEMMAVINDYGILQSATGYIPPEGFDWGSFATKRAEIQVQYLFEKNKYPEWTPLLHEFLTKYGANDLYNAYVEQTQATGVEVNDWVSPTGQ
ncbi:extracellular solute-binding protein [Paenibacillus eucommiae]|uniref:ABC-type glycerol-3-phosphate transport system substrate-binding protein n=1 Tax=Paenibacillus eucommiae TaxID=1355755 RepID=A0ABS4J063_9BACL|nr:extracellular solute-binding protein [Paenibacillus eucommiae]MBP1993232.1 ABC-type glycerol-3-phosphate transport system substrate-binding protein [Paenibacillus eucommiae]